MTAMRMTRQLMKKPAMALKLQRRNMIDPHSFCLSVFTSKWIFDHLLLLSTGFISVIDVHLPNIISCQTIQQEVGLRPVIGASAVIFSAFLLKDAVCMNLCL